MVIEISNCNNIEHGEITLVEGALNIKYAINGTGKSSIAHALSAAIQSDTDKLDAMVPYKFLSDKENHNPKITGIDSIHAVKTFNEEYIDQYVYKTDEVIQNSFEIFVKTPDYDERMQEIQKLLESISQIFQSHPELDELIINFSQFIEGCGKAKSGYSAAGAIGKGLGKGNKVENIPKGLEVYKPYLQHTDDALNVKWIKWQLDGQRYLPLANQCPYCSNSIETKKETILKVGEEYNAKDIEHLNKILNVFKILFPYFDNNTKDIIQGIINNIDGITDEQKNYISEIKKQIDTILNQLRSLKNIGFYSLKNTDKVADELKRFRIDLSLFNHLQSTLTKEKVDIINKSLNDVLEKAGILQGELNKQKKLIKQTIEENSGEINYFLQCAGYNYEVFIEETDNQSYRMLLKPKSLEIKIDSIKQHLSYGERNAFALALFMFDALKENPDLVILDDPISSFDGNKKFAIINMLFLSKKCLHNRTVLLLTHEFNTVIDIIHTMPYNFNPAPHAHFLTTKKGHLVENEIRKSDISSFRKIALLNIKSQIDTLNKLVYLRRLIEIEQEQPDGNKGEAWNMLSSLFHKRPAPTIEDRLMTANEISSAITEICKYVPDFDYDTEYKKTQDNNQLITIYNGSKSNYEKLQIYRILYDGKKIENRVLQKFINETFHTENDYLFQLNPQQYDTVPQYIIDACDEDINTFISI